MAPLVVAASQSCVNDALHTGAKIFLKLHKSPLYYHLGHLTNTYILSNVDTEKISSNMRLQNVFCLVITLKNNDRTVLQVSNWKSN